MTHPPPQRLVVRDPQGVAVAEILVGGSLLTLYVGELQVSLTARTAFRLAEELIAAAVEIKR